MAHWMQCDADIHSVIGASEAIQVRLHDHAAQVCLPTDFTQLESRSLDALAKLVCKAAM